jgi:hypothetical protein
MENAGEIADNAIANESGHLTNANAFAEDVAKDSGIGDAHGVDHSDASGRHALDGGTG